MRPPAINLPGGLKPAGPNWLGLPGYNWDTACGVLIDKFLISQPLDCDLGATQTP